MAALGALGFVNSFEKVRSAAHPIFGRLDWTVPVGIDLGIGVFSALGIVLAVLNMPIRWLRVVPWSLVAVTVYLNIAGEQTLFAQVAHAVLPCLWVVAVEVGTHAVKIRAGLAAGTSMDTIRLSRWLLAPLSTARLQRRMILWEVRSYPHALELEAARLLALCDLQDTYGRWGWRWKAPRRQRVMYRLGAANPTNPTTREPTNPISVAIRPADQDGATPPDQDTSTVLTSRQQPADQGASTIAPTGPIGHPADHAALAPQAAADHPAVRRIGAGQPTPVWWPHREVVGRVLAGQLSIRKAAESEIGRPYATVNGWIKSAQSWVDAGLSLAACGDG